MLELAVMGIASTINLLLGLIVYLKNPKSATNKLFMMLASGLAAWSVVSYISIHPFLFSQVVWVRLVLFFAAFLCLCVFLTFTVFPSTHMVGSFKIRKLAISYTIFVMCLVLTPFVFIADASGKPIPTFGIGFFSILVVSLLGGGLYNLLNKYKRSSGKEKRQLKAVIMGLSTTFGLIFITNFVFVVLFNFTKLIFLGPAFTLIFSGAMAYAIIKHKLFDIKLVIARALGYILSIGVVIGLYSLIVVSLGQQIFINSSPTLREKIIPPLAAIVLGLSYPSFKRFFDKATNRIFYRDAYDPQTLLDKLNGVLIGNIELEILLRRSCEVIQDNLKSEFCLVITRETQSEPPRIFSSGQAYGEPRDLIATLKDLAELGNRQIITDDLAPYHRGLRRQLSANGIEIVTPVFPGANTNEQALAYVALGPKKSGNLYDKQDLHIIEIIADELVIAIQNALRFEEIQAFNATLQDRINHATKRLEHSNQKLKELDETKDEFISMASHQLRTPLTSVKGYLSMVIEGDAGKLNKMQSELLEQAFTSSQRMVYLIADLLNVSRLKTGKFIIDAHPTNLADMVETEIKQLKEGARTKKIKLEYKRPADFPSLMLDETKTRQVIMNFIDNAIYYTPAGGLVSIELKIDKSNVYFIVTDTGLGVPKDEQAHLFTKFYRASNAQKARPDGTGLGLFMAKKVIQVQGGTVLFHSKEGQGSMFGFSFQKSKLAPPKA